MRIRSSASDGIAVNRSSDNLRERRPLGELLGLDDIQRDRVVQRQAETGHLFGETTVELGFVTAEQVQRAIEQQQGFSILRQDDQRVDPLIVTAFDPEDVLARAARSLRGIITAAMRQDGKPVRTVGLLGLDATAELPVLAGNVAVACAQTGVPTLLIDAELDQPHQHTLFRTRNRAGLATLLSSGGQSGLVQSTAIVGLSLLTSGPAVPNAPELLDRQRLATTIELFVEDFDLLLVDAGCGANALAVAMGLDASILFLRRNVSQTRDLQIVTEQLEASGQVVLGTVLMD